MSRLPTALQPAWPLFKRLHRILTVLAGLLTRRLAVGLGERGVPRTAFDLSVDTAAHEPAAVTLHPAGPPELIERAVPDGSPAGHWRFAEASTAQVPARYVLEVRDGRASGDFGAVITPGDVLDYQTSGYFGLAGWREHPVFLKPTLGEVEHLEGTVLNLNTRGCSSNYYHFLYDAIGRLGILDEALPGERPETVIVAHQTRYQKELLALAGVEGRFVQPRAGVTYRADRLLVPSTPNQDLDAPRSTTAWLRKHLPPTGRTDTPKRLYLTRGQQPNTRRYVEEPELVPLLEERGFTVLDPGTLSVQEQIDVFHGAEVVMAPHGAALTNLTFCSPGTKVLEMFAPSYVHLGLWTICESIGDITYRYLVGDGDHRQGRSMTGVLEDVSIPPTRVEEALDDLLG